VRFQCIAALVHTDALESGAAALGPSKTTWWVKLTLKSCPVRFQCIAALVHTDALESGAAVLGPSKTT